MRPPDKRKLNKLDGVTATVNYATEKAKVSYVDGVATDDLVAAVEAAGYGARLPEPAAASSGENGPDSGPAASLADSEAATALDALRNRLIISALLTVPVVAVAMVPAWQFTNWQ